MYILQTIWNKGCFISEHPVMVRCTFERSLKVSLQVKQLKYGVQFTILAVGKQNCSNSKYTHLILNLLQVSNTRDNCIRIHKHYI